MAPPLHVLIVEDHPLYRDALTLALRGLGVNAQQGLRFSAAAGQAQALQTLGWHPDTALVVADQGLSEGHGLGLLAEVGRRWPTIARVLMSGADDPRLAAEAWRLGLMGFMGFMGFIRKSLEPAEFVRALDGVLAGEPWFPPDPQAVAGARELLTERQAAVLECAAAGQSNKEVARTLGISERTIKYHLESAFSRLGASSRAEAVAAALTQGLIRPPG